ncbi:MAG: hypothetical protein ABUS54_11125 [Actinomycetota bacterium]
MSSLRLIAAATAALAAACAFTASSQAGTKSCNGYSYAGVQTLQPERGLAATITPLRQWTVTSGHVAAWVGVGGAGLGAGGQDEWLQIGIAVLPGGTSEIYYEVTLPGQKTQYTSVQQVTNGESHRVGVVEKAPNAWQAFLDGRAVSPLFTLPGSHASWSPIATSESYDGGVTSCNAYSFRIDQISYSPLTGGWFPAAKMQPFASSAHSVSTLAPNAIVVDRR